MAFPTAAIVILVLAVVLATVAFVALSIYLKKSSDIRRKDVKLAYSEKLAEAETIKEELDELFEKDAEPIEEVVEEPEEEFVEKEEITFNRKVWNTIMDMGYESSDLDNKLNYTSKLKPLIGEFKTRCRLSRVRFINKIESILGRELSGKYPLSYIRNFNMDGRSCDLVIHWPAEDGGRSRECALVRCQYSPSVGDKELGQVLDEGIRFISEYGDDFNAKYGNRAKLLVVVTNFPVPNTYNYPIIRDDLICIRTEQFDSLVSAINTSARDGNKWNLSSYLIRH